MAICSLFLFNSKYFCLFRIFSKFLKVIKVHSKCVGFLYDFYTVYGELCKTTFTFILHSCFFSWCNMAVPIHGKMNVVRS